MDDYELTIYNILKANAPLVALATGGIYRRIELPVKGITQQEIPTAYDSNGILKPVIVVASLAAQQDGRIADTLTGYQAMTQVVAIWYYLSAYENMTLVRSLQTAVYNLLHNQPLSNIAELYLESLGNSDRDPNTFDMIFARDEYRVLGFIARS